MNEDVETEDVETEDVETEDVETEDVETDDVEAVARRFSAYEAALMADDLDALADFFWPDATRYGTDGNQVGGSAIDAARRRPHPPLDRRLHDTSIRPLAEGAVLAETEFTRAGGARGRQSQVWTRRHDEWRVVHAHVSMLPGSYVK